MGIQEGSFEEAIEESIFWCNAWAADEISDEVLSDKVASLIEKKDGARGFFAVSLSSESPLMDRLPDPLVLKLRAAGKAVIDLTVRNLAMSSAMSIHHQRNKDDEMKAGSIRVKKRCQELLRLLEPNEVKETLEKFLKATKGTGGEVDFLKRWNYDDAQKTEIALSINAVAEN